MVELHNFVPENMTRNLLIIMSNLALKECLGAFDMLEMPLI